MRPTSNDFRSGVAVYIQGVYTELMNTTTEQNKAHRTDLAWTKTPGKSFRVGGELYLSEYRNAFAGQTIRKGWRMTGVDWFIFNAADEIVGREHSLTVAKFEAGEK